MQAINNLRGIAILMIVLTHANIILLQLGPLAQFIDYYIGNFTLIFIFIAGYLFASQADGLKYTSYLKTKLLTVALPYTIISLPAALFLVTGARSYHWWIDMNWFYSLNPVVRYLYLWVTGAMQGPLWFMPMIILFYLAAPFFLLLVNRGPLMILLVAILLPVADIVSRPFNNSNALQSFIYYLPIYIMGMATFRYRALLPRPGTRLTIACFLYLIAMAAVYFVGMRDQMVTYVPLCFVLLLLMKRFCDHRIAWLDMFARLSFFIFFIHAYFRGIERVFFDRILAIKTASNMLMSLALTLGSFAFIIASCLVSYVILKLITGNKSRYLIGG